MDKVKLFIINESASHSIISDIFTFGCVFAGFFVNYKFLGDSSILQVFLVILFLMATHYRGSREIKRMSPREALKYLSKKYDNN